MESGRRDAYSFRGRVNERTGVNNETLDNINERRQQDRFVLMLECQLPPFFNPYGHELPP